MPNGDSREQGKRRTPTVALGKRGGESVGRIAHTRATGAFGAAEGPGKITSTARCTRGNGGREGKDAQSKGNLSDTSEYDGLHFGRAGEVPKLPSPDPGKDTHRTCIAREYRDS